MACATLAVKRHRHFDFEPLERSHKRRRISATKTTLSSAMAPTRKQEEDEFSPFANLGFLLSWDQDELMSRIRYHVKRFNRQKFLAEQQNAPSASNDIQNAQLPHIIHPTTQLQQHLLPSNQLLPDIQTNQIEGLNPRFTLKQASILCEKAMKEKEKIWKLEYEQILSSRLAEQYECFLKFNNDSMYRGPKEQASSYVS
ncbi:hypothetical protein HELRODRAFT_185607 [Helobdella robusta]|uniref:Akirin n=1 Tax=Helobdella robusta TaxID=6412 RepID=T1FN12_HELRO|nr:hypothetical protein HELRODRAFT_185607 [Helobdella robusta]ESO03562.1 hypothetical protein HELRODRAFT_185607 [Helobdella robusta]